MHQAYGVNPTTGAFAGACGGDAYPKGIKISVKATRGQFKRKTITKHWGNRRGKMAARFGQIVGDGCGFLLAWSSKGNASSGPHELMVTRLDASGGNLPGFPKKLSNDQVDKSDVTVVPFESGYLVGYRAAGDSKFLKLDAQANKIGASEAVHAPAPPSPHIPVVDKGGDGCTSSKKCGACEGDCDKDSHCQSGLKCFQRKASSTIVPGCASTGYVKGRTDHDYCYDPKLSPSPPTPAPTPA